MKNGYRKAVLVVSLIASFASAALAAGAPATLIATQGVLGFPAIEGIPVYGDIDAIRDGLTRGNPVAAMNSNIVCNALNGTMVEVYEDTRTRVGTLGDFMKVTILNGDCEGREGWVRISNIYKAAP